MLNVDPEKQADPFYRYKMPRCQIKIEGSGNGIKTVLPNIADISERIARPVEYPVRFFAHELAAMAHFKDEKWILMGNFTQETIQKSLFDFIRKFVLCKSCRNPETIMTATEAKDILLNCKACSRITSVDPREKLCNNILKTLQPTTSEKGSKKGKGTKKSKKEKSKDEKEEEEYNAATRQAKDGETVEAAAPEEKANPVELLKAFVFTDPKPHTTDIIGKVFDLKQDYGLGDKHVVALVFEAVFSEKISTEIPEHAPLLRRIVKDDTEVEIIHELQLLCADQESIQKKFHIILKKLYDHEIVSEETILTWHSGKTKKGIPKALQAEWKEKCEPFIEWLKGESEEEDEEEEEKKDDDDDDEQANDDTKDAEEEGQKEKDGDDDEDIDIDGI